MFPDASVCDKAPFVISFPQSPARVSSCGFNNDRCAGGDNRPLSFSPLTENNRPHIREQLFFCLVWVEDFKSSRERFQRALIMPPLLFSHLQVHALNASPHMSAGLESQLCFDVEEAHNWHVVLRFNRWPPRSFDLLACLDAGSVRQRRRRRSAEGAQALKAVVQMFGSCLIPPSAPPAPAPLKHRA